MTKSEGAYIAIGAALGFLIWEGTGLAPGAGIGLALSAAVKPKPEDSDAESLEEDSAEE